MSIMQDAIAWIRDEINPYLWRKPQVVRWYGRR